MNRAVGGGWGMDGSAKGKGEWNREDGARRLTLRDLKLWQAAPPASASDR